MNFKAIQAAVIGCIFTCVAAHAEFRAKPGCEPMLTVTPIPLDVRDDFTRGLAHLDALNQQAGHALTRSGQGIGSTRVVISASNTTTYDADACPRLNIRVGYADAVVYVARELSQIQCAHDHVLAHERHHVEMYRNALETLPERVKAKSEPNLSAVYSSAAPEQEILVLLERAMDEAAAVMVLQTEFDSEEEYAKNEVACDGAISRVYKRWLRAGH